MVKCMEYLQLSLDEYTQSKEEIKKELGGIVKSFVQIGWHLTRIDKSGAYKTDGYQTIAEFAKAEYGLSATTTSRFMSVYETYSIEGDTPELKEQYREYNSSQLVELLQVREEDRCVFQPEARREDIREFHRFEKENENSVDNLLNWKAAKTTEEKIRAAVYEFFRENKEILNALYGKDPGLKELAEMIAPSGSRSYRKGTVFLMFYTLEKGILIKVFGEQPEEMPYQKFVEQAKQIFDGSAAGNHTWENCFAGPEKKTDVPQPEEPGDSEQIPGQDSILDHPEYMPKPEIAPAQKTEEQKYMEQQAKLDRETKKKLQEQEDREKMEHLPSDEGQRAHQLRLAGSYYDLVASKTKSFELRKNDRGYRVGDHLELMEFRDGRNTGRMIKAEITYILEDYTGLEDGYCIMAIAVTAAD